MSQALAHGQVSSARCRAAAPAGAGSHDHWSVTSGAGGGDVPRSRETARRRQHPPHGPAPADGAEPPPAAQPLGIPQGAGVVVDAREVPLDRRLGALGRPQRPAGDRRTQRREAISQPGPCGALAVADPDGEVPLVGGRWNCNWLRSCGDATRSHRCSGEKTTFAISRRTPGTTAIGRSACPSALHQDSTRDASERLNHPGAGNVSLASDRQVPVTQRCPTGHPAVAGDRIPKRACANPGGTSSHEARTCWRSRALRWSVAAIR